MLRAARTTVQRVRADAHRRAEVGRLAADADASGPTSQLRDALATTRRIHRDPAARRWADRIETERARLAASRDEIAGGRGTVATVGEVTRRASAPRHQGLVLHALARHLTATAVLELGTCVGISGAYLAAALDPARARLRSLEGHADRARVAADTWDRLGLHHAEVTAGRFHRTLDDALADGPYDLVHVDGDHDGEATLDHVRRIAAASRPGALLVLDDIDWSAGMRRAWQQLRTEFAGSATSDLGRVGCLLLGEEDAGQR
ncbi:class I SAM-dependent methyltransferase [Nitriliruptoraceae bacterium ZYF776]|nr:class I SAM-dependent methyltransferase [Profundirhabdus halotolerans]